MAGFGSVLRADDGVGVHVVQRLVEGGVPENVDVLEIGSGGIHLVQELLDETDALIVVDSLVSGRLPGSVAVVVPDVADPSLLGVHDLRDQVADMHLANPHRALTVARGLGVLPDKVWIVGVEPVEEGAWGEELSPPVAAAVAVATAQVREVVTAAGIPWPAPAEG